MSSTAPTASRLRSASRFLAPAGSRSISPEATSSPSPTPARVGPSPSCRSRRSRRRSSSRAWTRPVAGRPQGVGEARGEDRSTRRPCELRQQGFVAGRERAPVASFHQQAPDLLALVGQGPLGQRHAAGAPGAGPDAVGGLHRDVRQAQGRGDRVGNGDEGLARLGCTLKPRGEAGQGRVRIPAVAVHGPVHQSLEGGAQRQHEGRDHAGRDDAGAPGPELATQGPEDSGVQRDHAEGQPGVDESPVEDDVDVVEVMAQDREPDRERHRRDRQGHDDRCGPGGGVVAHQQLAEEGNTHAGRRHEQERDLPPLHTLRGRAPPPDRQCRDAGRQSDEHQRVAQPLEKPQRRLRPLQPDRIVRHRMVDEWARRRRLHAVRGT